MKRSEFLKRTLAAPIAAVVGVAMVKKPQMDYKWVDQEDIDKNKMAGWALVGKQKERELLKQRWFASNYNSNRIFSHPEGE